jgi:hypothetical protein
VGQRLKSRQGLATAAFVGISSAVAIVYLGAAVGFGVSSQACAAALARGVRSRRRMAPAQMRGNP